MPFIYFNNNPAGRHVGDCAVRAISVALGIDWETAYTKLFVNGYKMGDMLSSNSVIWSVLRENGFQSAERPPSCPDCYTVKEFCNKNPDGVFVLFTSGHVVTAVNGGYFDSWDSGSEILLYVWYEDIKPIF